MKKENKESFWGKPIKDENGRVVAYKDEFDDVRTPKDIVSEISGCLFMMLAVGGLFASCTYRVHEEIQKRRAKKEVQNQR